MSSQQPEIRASDAERERTGDLLREAAVEGRLTLDEFSERYLQTQQARTRDELDAVVRDLPVAAPAMSRGTPKSKLRAILSGIDQSGAWQLAPETEVQAIFGSCKLDLRQATISSDVTTLHVQVIFGSLDLIVPAGVVVDVDATALLSGSNVRMSGATRASVHQPRIHVTGLVLFGSINARDTLHFSERLGEAANSLLGPSRNDQRR